MHIFLSPLFLQTELLKARVILYALVSTARKAPHLWTSLWPLICCVYMDIGTSSTTLQGYIVVSMIGIHRRSSSVYVRTSEYNTNSCVSMATTPANQGRKGRCFFYSQRNSGKNNSMMVQWVRRDKKENTSMCMSRQTNLLLPVKWELWQAEAPGSDCVLQFITSQLQESVE